LKFAAGVKIGSPPLSETTQFEKLLTAVTVSVSFSGSVSLPTRPVNVIGVSSAVVSVSLFATGESFTALTVIVTVAVSVPPLPSLTV